MHSTTYFMICCVLASLPAVSAAAIDPCRLSVNSKPLETGHPLPQLDDGNRITYLGSFDISGEYKGTLIQSFAFDPVACAWITAASLRKEPEQVAIWAFSGVEPFPEIAGPFVSSAFSHPQDLSASSGEHGSVFWLPAQDLKGVVSFKVETGNRQRGIQGMRKFPLFDNAVPDLFAAISLDRKILVAMGSTETGIRRHRQTVRVYSVSDLELSLKTGNHPSPLAEWPLDQAQQEKSQWRQGLAILGHSVFVLTGNRFVETEKLLYTYGTSGTVLSREKIPVAPAEVRSLGKRQTYEPEGLEVVERDGLLTLVFGTATGGKGQRILTLRSIPLKLDAGSE